jgi:anti-sigma factor RsiW
MTGARHGCDAVHDELAELALGTLSGRARSEVLDHVTTCARCSAELQQLSAVADELLQLAPQIEPPVGFELRVAERLGLAAVPRRSRRRRAPLVAAAAALVLVLVGATVGVLASRDGSGSSGNRPAIAAPLRAELTSQGRTVGDVSVSNDRPAWMYVTLDGMRFSGTVRCVLTLTGGAIQTAGVFRLTGDYGAWGVPLHVAPDDVRTVEVVDDNGAVLAAARFAS